MVNEQPPEGKRITEGRLLLAQDILERINTGFQLPDRDIVWYDEVAHDLWALASALLPEVRRLRALTALALTGLRYASDRYCPCYRPGAGDDFTTHNEHHPDCPAGIAITALEAEQVQP